MVKSKKRERFIKKHVYLTIVGIMIIVFIAGILLGRFSTTSEVDEITKFIKDSELSTESYLIEQNLIESLGRETCDLSTIRINKLSEELWLLGKSLIQEDAKEKLGEDNFNFLKRRFHLLQIRTYTKYKELSENCNLSEHIILYYYSISDDGSFEQGKILDELVKNFDVNVFAIEFDYSPELSFLEDYYAVKSVPTIVVDYDTKFEKLVSYEELASLLK